MFGFMKSLGFKITLGITIALLVIIGVQSVRIASLKHKLYEADLATVNAIAERDSTRNVTNQLRGVLAAERAASERYIQQLELHRDALDKALKRASRVMFSMGIRIDSLNARLIALGKNIHDDSAGTRTATFENYRKVPFTVQAKVSLPRPNTGVGTLDLTIKADDIWINGRVQCDNKRLASGVRKAVFLIDQPDWTHVSLDSLRQSREVCSDVSVTKEAASSRAAKGAAAGAITGVVGGAISGSTKNMLLGGMLGSVVGAILRVIF